MLSNQLWQQLEQLFHQASNLPQDQWAAFAREQAGHDPALLLELQAMLGAAGQATQRLRAPLQQAAASLMSPPLEAGTRCGAWAIDSLIGAGGMGRVYLGHRADGAYEQQVAIKLVATPLLDQWQQAFFQYECRMQAQMQHPAIARIHDAGVHQGQGPYLVMEYINGLRIDRWCAAHRARLDERVQLLVQVCQGVQHAHQKGVIHRDLKPGNVLVDELDGKPHPKIIDFGIAVASVEPGQVGWVVGTPGYMSPEQADNQQDIDVRSDVYSLGVLLHQLLTGQKAPLDGPTAHSPLRHLMADPPALSSAATACRCTTVQLRRGLENGLDAIVARATAADRSQRYAGVGGLLQDLERWQRHQLPVGCTAPPWRRLRLFVRRHWLPSLAASVVLFSTLMALTASLWSLSQARAQQRVADQRSAQLERAVAFQQQMLQSVDVDAMGHAITADQDRDGTDLARDLLERHVVVHGLASLQRDFGDDPALGTELHQALAGVLVGIGRYPAAVTELQSVLQALHEQNQPAAKIMSATIDLSDALYLQGNFAQARHGLVQLEDKRHRVAEGHPLWLRAGIVQARLLLAEGEPQPALAHQLQLEQQWRQHLSADNEHMIALGLDIVRTQTRLSQREQALQRMQGLMPHLQASYGQADARTLAGAMTMADLLNTATEYERSLALAQQVRQARQSKLGRNHPLVLQAMALEGANRVRLAQDTPAWVATECFMDRLLQQQRQEFGADHPDTLQSMADLIRLLAKQGDAGKLDQAITLQRELLQVRMRVLGPQHPDTLFSWGGLANLLARTPRHAEARAAALTAMAGFKQVMPEHSTLSALWGVLARIEENAGNLQAARQAHATALGMRYQRRGLFDPHTTESASRLYRVLSKQGDAAEMASVRQRYLDPVVARDPAALNAAGKSVRDEAIRMLAGH